MQAIFLKIPINDADKIKLMILQMSQSLRHYEI